MYYLIRFVQEHETFRRPEIEALARLAQVKVDILQYSPDSPFCVIDLEPIVQSYKSPDEIAAAFISRSFLSKGIYELWAEAPDYNALHEKIKQDTQHLWSQYNDVTFKFTVDAFYGKRSMQEQKEIITSFSYLGFRGKINMKHPQAHFLVFEEWQDDSAVLSRVNLAAIEATHDQDDQLHSVAQLSPKRIFLARHLGGTSRLLADKHDLKKRPYISTTSMDALLALVTANLALAAPGKLILDPFVGTGGFMVAASELGAITLGTDIDGRSFRGSSTGLHKGVGANFKKYNLTSCFGDCFTSDLTNTPFRTRSTISTSRSKDSGRWLDAIISDPPYGVREGLKVLGVRNSKVDRAIRITDHTLADPNTIGPYLVDGVPAHTLPGYIAPKKPYSFTAMLDDILAFAAATLVDGGRLAFWMPSANDDFVDRMGERSTEGYDVNGSESRPKESATSKAEPAGDTTAALPSHPQLDLKHVCTQSFNKWSRKLLIYERVPDVISATANPTDRTSNVTVEASSHGNTSYNPDDGGSSTPQTRISADDLNPFRRMYFKGFQQS